jgi:hypothetical protein
MDATRFKTLFDREGIDIIVDGRDGSMQMGFSSPSTVTYIPIERSFTDAMGWAKLAVEIRALPERA